MDISVRPATLDDAGRMGEIQVASWRATHATELGPQVVSAFDPAQFAEQWASAFTRHGASPVHALLVAVHGSDVVGFAAVQPSPDPDAPDDDSAREITALFVSPDRWRQGHGSRLLAACSDTARGHGAVELRTWVTAGDQARAAFFSGAGFEPDGAERTMQIEPGRTLTERRFSAVLA